MARPRESGTLIDVRQAHLTVITGLPGTGKSTLARALARHFGAPLICKDTIKEPLLDVIGATDRAESRRLSDASFAVMFSLARDCLSAGTDLILEGNFRPGEHEAELLTSISQLIPSARASAVATSASANNPPDVDSVHVTQILCRASEPARIARLKARAADPSRHSGHRDAELAVVQSPPPMDFLALPGERLVFDSDDAYTQLQLLLDAMEQQHRGSSHV